MLWLRFCVNGVSMSGIMVVRVIGMCLVLVVGRILGLRVIIDG